MARPKTPKRSKQPATAPGKAAKAAPPGPMFVRLKPYNPRRGYVLRKYTYLPSGKKFEEARGWYRVDEDIAEALRDLHQNPRDIDSPLAFDVCTESEARRIDAAEKKEKERRDTESANDLTTTALRRGTETAEITPADERRVARARRTPGESSFRRGESRVDA